MAHLVEDASSIVVGNDGESVLSTLKLSVKLLVKVFALFLCTNDVHQLPATQATRLSTYSLTHSHKLMQNYGVLYR